MYVKMFQSASFYIAGIFTVVCKKPTCVELSNAPVPPKE